MVSIQGSKHCKLRRACLRHFKTWSKDGFGTALRKCKKPRDAGKYQYVVCLLFAKKAPSEATQKIAARMGFGWSQASATPLAIIPHEFSIFLYRKPQNHTAKTAKSAKPVEGCRGFSPDCPSCWSHRPDLKAWNSRARSSFGRCPPHQNTNATRKGRKLPELHQNALNVCP